MKLLKHFLSSLFLPIILAGVTSGPALAQKKPEKIRLSSASEEGAVLLRVTTIGADYRLVFHNVESTGFGSRVYAVFVDGGNGEEVYVGRTLKPGRYHLDSLIQQKRWVLPFNDTIEIEIKPGKITYLGTLNSQDLLTSLQGQAIEAGRAVVGVEGYGAQQRDNHPTFTDRDSAGLAEATDFAVRFMAATPGMLELGELYESRSDKK